MSSSRPPGGWPQLQPGTVIEGLTVEPAGVVWWQWLTFFALGNIIAGYWLVLALLNANPELKYKLHQLLVKFGLRKPLPGKSVHSGSAGAGSGNSKTHEQLPPVISGPVSPQKQPQQQLSAHAEPPSPTVAPSPVPSQPSSPKPVTLQTLNSSSGPLPTLRSHRSARPPPEICLEQALSHRTSLGQNPASPRADRAAAAQAPAGTTPAAAAAGDKGAGAPTPSSVYFTPAATPQPTYAVAEGTEGTEGSSTCSEGEPARLVKLEWRNLCYAVKAASGLRLIVQGVYGCANPGELQGLMGPSGAGKSTLMDLLSKRTDPTGSAAAEAALQHQSLSQKLKTITSHRSSDATGASSSNDGGVTSPVSRGLAAARDSMQSAGLPSRIHAGGPLPHLESELLVNGAPLSRSAFMRLSAYVPQHDNLVPTMTSWESLSFYAGLVLPANTSADKKRKRIQGVLSMMGLAHARDTLVGGMLSGGIQLRGLSGGERKRLAIACGVVAGPSLVFLDEPTSGLDSFAALNVVLFLKNMGSQNGSTLIASLHQPRSAIWGQLDQITLLASGRLMYTGPTDGLTRWFTSLGYHYDPSDHGMASDWALDLVSLGFAKPQQGARPAPQQDQHDGQSEASSDAERSNTQQFRGLASVASGSLALQGLASLSMSRRRRQQLEASTDLTSTQQDLQDMQDMQEKCSMMSSKQELNEAAAAFLQHLRMKHADWFAGPSTGRAGTTSPLSTVREGTVVGSSGNSPAAEAGGDADESPFMMQEALPAMPSALQSISVQEPLQLTPTEQLEHGHVQDKGVWGTLYGGWRKYCALLWREALITTRNPADMGGRMLTFTYVAVLSGLVAWSTIGTAESILQRLGSSYFVLSFYLLMPFVFMSLFTSDKRFFAADTTARLYHPFQYYMAKISVTMPFNILVVAIFHLIYYGMVGMRHGVVPMGQSCLISILMGVTAMQAVYCCAIIASSQDLAFVFAIAWTALNLLVNPYMAPFDGYTLGWGWSWLRYCSPVNFAWQALVQIEMAGRGFDCNNSSGLQAIGIIPDLLPQGPSFRTVRDLISNLGQWSAPPKRGQCVASGDAIVEIYTTGLSFGATVGILIGYFALFMSVTYFVVYRSSKKRGSTL